MKTGGGSRNLAPILVVTWAIDGVDVELHAPAFLTPEKRTGTHCIGCRMGRSGRVR